MFDKLTRFSEWAKSRHASSYAVGVGVLVYAVGTWYGLSRDITIALAGGVICLLVPALNSITDEER